MEKFSCIIKNYSTKDGKRTFSAMSAKGKYLDGIAIKSSVPLNPEETYFLKFTQSSAQALPAVEGIYEVSVKNVHDGADFGNSEAWLDEREAESEAKIVRIKLDRCEVSFEKKGELKPFKEKPAEQKIDRERLPF